MSAVNRRKEGRKLDLVHSDQETGKTGVAVHGTGSIGLRHLKLLHSAGVAPIYAIPVRKTRRAELEAVGFSTVAHTGELPEGVVASVVVATDTARHPEDACYALNAGYHVLVEKPVAVTAPEGRSICERASHLSRRAYVGCLLRFSESMNTFRDLLERIGRVHSVRIECQSYLPDWRPDRSYREAYSARADEGGVLRDLIHEIDYAGWIFGWPTAVQANLRNSGHLGIEAEEAVDLLWEGEGGCSVSISLDYLTRATRRRMYASGEHGEVEWNGIGGAVTLALAGEVRRSFNSAQTRDGELLAQDLAFIKACSGTPDPRLATCEDGLSALAICDAARRASVTRCEERVLYVSR